MSQLKPWLVSLTVCPVENPVLDLPIPAEEFPH
jgi:hypothetical protein